MPTERLDIATVAHFAGIIDLQAVIRTRTVPGVEPYQLPYLGISGTNTAALRYLGQLTGTKPTITRRTYSRAGCAVHCKEKHQHIVSVSGRWSITGARATVVLWNVRPHLRLQVDDATSALAVGMAAGFKTPTMRKMAELGWDIPHVGG